MIVDLDRRYLHLPERADRLDSLDEHAAMAAAFTRAAWVLLDDRLAIMDARDMVALRAVLSAAADHASAADAILGTGRFPGSDRPIDAAIGPSDDVDRKN